MAKGLSDTVLARRKGISEDQMRKRRKAAADPVRQRILDRFFEDRDWTAKELADALGVGANGLYYHLRILEDAGLIAVAGSRAPGKMVEKTYRMADNRHIDWELDEDLAMVFASLLESAKHDTAEAVYDLARRAEEGDEGPFPVVDVSAPSFMTTTEEAAEFYERLRALVNEFRTRANDLREIERGTPASWRNVKLTYAFRDRPLPAAEPAPA